MVISQYRDRNWLAPWREFNQVSRRVNRAAPTALIVVILPPDQVYSSS